MTVVVVVSPPTPLVRVMGLVKFGAELPDMVWGTEVVLKTAGGGLSDELIERDCAGRGCVGREVGGTDNVDVEDFEVTIDAGVMLDDEADTIWKYLFGYFVWVCSFFSSDMNTIQLKNQTFDGPVFRSRLDNFFLNRASNRYTL